MSKINIAYYRVSTKKQGDSGLGLEAQKALVFGFLRQEPDFEFTEVESGKIDSRVQLDLATEMARKTGGRLVIAKLDRLSRDVHFISGMMKSKVDFVCCDNPNANPLTLHILAAFAENEALVTSERTKRALQAKIEREKAAGNLDFKLGAPKGQAGFCYTRTPKPGRKTFQQMLDKKNEVLRNKVLTNPNISKAIPFITYMRKNKKSLDEIAEELNRIGIKTSRGCEWSRSQVARMYKVIDFKETPKGKEGYVVNSKDCEVVF